MFGYYHSCYRHRLPVFPCSGEYHCCIFIQLIAQYLVSLFDPSLTCIGSQIVYIASKHINTMSFPIANVPVNEGLFSPKVKAEILSKIEPLVTNCKGDRERLAAWFFDEETLIREDIQYSGFLELDEFVGIFISRCHC